MARTYRDLLAQTRQEIREVDPREGQAMAKAGAAMIDVREADEVEQGLIRRGPLLLADSLNRGSRKRSAIAISRSLFTAPAVSARRLRQKQWLILLGTPMSSRWRGIWRLEDRGTSPGDADPIHTLNSADDTAVTRMLTGSR